MRAVVDVLEQEAVGGTPPVLLEAVADVMAMRREYITATPLLLRMKVLPS
jgi:hypothetical protein